MKVAITGATGFVGRALASQLVEAGNTLRCWHRSDSDLNALASLDDAIFWVPGNLPMETPPRRWSQAVMRLFIQGCGDRACRFKSTRPMLLSTPVSTFSARLS